jgi:hypothetical protein
MLAIVPTLLVPGLLVAPGAARTRAPARAPHSCLVEGEIPYDIHFLRAAKTAVSRALEDEGGLLDEDALATIGALADVNPSKPDPANDNDLWSGSWVFRTASLLSGPGSLEQRSRGDVVLEESGALEVEVTLAVGAAGTPATLGVAGQISADGDDVLELECERVVLSTPTDDAEASAAVTSVAEAMGLTLERVSDAWVAAPPLPALRLAQLYLDQDCHILGVLSGAEADVQRDPLQPLVLFKKRRA